MIQGTVDNGFSQARFVDKLIASDKIEDILQQFEQYQAPARNGQMPTFNHK